MGRRSTIFLLVVLAAGLFYGRFVVPWHFEADPREAELQQLRDENELLLDLLGKSASDIEKEIAKRRIEREIALSPRPVSNNLMQEYKVLLAHFEAARTPFKHVADPYSILGKIKAIDPLNGLVTIDLGSDSGIDRGCILVVCRGSEETYVGVIRMTDVRPNEATAKFVGQQSSVRVGDQVTSDSLRVHFSSRMK